MTDKKKKFTDEEIKNLANYLYKRLENHYRDVDDTIGSFLYENFGEDMDALERFQKEWGSENILGSELILDSNINEIDAKQQQEEVVDLSKSKKRE